MIEELGFSYLTYPVEGIEPLMILEAKEENLLERFITFITKQGLVTYLVNDDIFSLFPGKLGAPKNGPPREAGSFQGFNKFSDQIKAGAAFELSRFNIKNKNGVHVKYEFLNVKIQSVEHEVQLEKYLKIKKPADSMLPRLKANLYFVITDVLVTNRYSVALQTDGNMQGQIDLEHYLHELEIHSKFRIEKKEKNKIYYKDNDHFLTFALKAKRIFYHADEDKFSLSRTKIKSVLGDADLDSETL